MHTFFSFISAFSFSLSLEQLGILSPHRNGQDEPQVTSPKHTGASGTSAADSPGLRPCGRAGGRWQRPALLYLLASSSGGENRPQGTQAVAAGVQPSGSPASLLPP